MIRVKKAIRTGYDPYGGSGGMLTIAREHVTPGLRRDGGLRRPAINPGGEIHLFGEEVKSETWAGSLATRRSRQ